jgi:hypothetical protein
MVVMAIALLCADLLSADLLSAQFALLILLY